MAATIIPSAAVVQSVINNSNSNNDKLSCNIPQNLQSSIYKPSTNNTLEKLLQASKFIEANGIEANCYNQFNSNNSSTAPQTLNIHHNNHHLHQKPAYLEPYRYPFYPTTNANNNPIRSFYNQHQTHLPQYPTIDYQLGKLIQR